MKAILYSLMVIALVGGMVGTGLFAHFTDTETSEGNTFQAGSIDLRIDVDGQWYNGNPFPLWGDHVDPDIKPCMGGEETISLHNDGMNDAELVEIIITVTEDAENGCIEPEITAGDDPDSDNGELDEFLHVTVWKDMYDEGGVDLDGDGVVEFPGDNIFDETEEEVLADDMIADILADLGYNGPGAYTMTLTEPMSLPVCEVKYLGMAWHFDQPDDVNLSMTDSFGGTFTFKIQHVVQ